MKTFINKCLLFVILGISTNATFPNRDEEKFYTNPLILNGKPLDYSTFSKSSKGVLAVVKGDPKSGGSPKVPFKIYLRHAGKVIDNGVSSDTRE